MSEDVILSIVNKNNDGIEYFLFFCPGCKHGHMFQTPKWEFNKDMKKPTIRASYLCVGNPEYLKRSNGKHGHNCHSYITNGKIEFLSDCTHDLAGKTVDLQPVFKNEKELY